MEKMNKITIIGSTGSDPVSRVVGDGIQVCSFSVAVNSKKKDESPVWFRVTAWRQLADLCQRYVTKGKKIAVVGSVSLNTYTGNDGKQRASLEVNADEVEFLSPRDERKQETPDERAGFVEVTDPSEQLPF